MPSIGMVAADSSRLISTNVSIQRVKEIGFIQSASDSSHSGLSIETPTGLESLPSPRRHAGTLTTSGTTSTIEAARGVGVLAAGLQSVSLSALTVDKTELRPAIGDAMEIFQIGDGLALIGIQERISLSEVSLLNTLESV